MKNILAFAPLGPSKPSGERNTFPLSEEDEIPIEFVPTHANSFFAPPTLTEENWLLYATRNYTNPNCASHQEFMDDMRRFKYLRKLFTHYEKSGELKERLILNHIIVLNNVLHPIALTRLLFLKIKNLVALKPFLVGTSLLPRIVSNINGRNYETDMIPLDPTVVMALRKLGIR